MYPKLAILVCAVALWASPSAAQAEVNIETVPVGYPWNDGEWSGESYGGFAPVPDRICGAVDYVYNIGKYEVTAGQYREFLNAVAATDAYGLYNPSMDSSECGCQITQNGINGSYTYDFSGRPSGTEADWANRPVNFVSWGDAARFANWLHNSQPPGPQNASTTEDGVYFLNGATSEAALLAVMRKADWKWAITSEDEWYKAAYHKNDGVTGNYFDYPTSSDNMPGRDMSEVTNPDNNANYYGNPFPIDAPYYMTTPGEFELSDSPYGTFDQGGNVWEWNEATWARYRGARGGSFGNFDGDSGVFLHAAMRSRAYPWAEKVYIGFRVSQVPEPATLSLLALGLATNVVRKRRT